MVVGEVGQGGQWQERVATLQGVEFGMGRRRAFIQAHCHGGRIYCAGGFFAHAHGVRSAQVESFELGSWARRKEGPLLAPRAWHASALLGGKMYVMGGNNGIQHLRTTEVVDLGCGGGGAWQRAPDMRLRRYAPAAAACQGAVFVAGGFGSDVDSCQASRMEFTASVEMLSTASPKWQEAPPLPFAMARMGMAAVNGRIYCVGGYNGVEPLNVVVSLDPRTSCWVPEPRMHLRRSYLSVVTLGHSLVALGGFNGERFSDTVEIWDTRMNKWLIARPLPSARAYMAAVAF